MIYTVTFNPSLDYIVRVNEFKTGTINRTVYEEILPGGKGINVSIVLNNLGIESVSLGFIAGFTGEKIEQEIQKMGCKTDFIMIPGYLSRINVKLKSDRETEINGQGPEITETELGCLFDKLNLLEEGDILVLAGSIPATLPMDIYEKIMERLESKNIKVIVDATKDLLLNVLKYHPFLIKPNNHELGEIFEKELTSNEELVFYGKKLQEKGARNILISMAGNGAIFLSEDGEVYESEAPEGELVNSVGAGDSMVAGFITGMLTKNNYKDAFKMGIAAGSASAFSPQLATKIEVERLLRDL